MVTAGTVLEKALEEGVGVERQLFFHAEPVEHQSTHVERTVRVERRAGGNHG